MTEIIENKKRFLAVCEATASLIASEGCWHWWYRGMAKTWEGAKKNKKTSCAHFVSMCMQRAGYMPEGCTVYCRNDGRLIYQGVPKKARQAVFEHFLYIPCDLPLKKCKIMPGDILGIYDGKMQHMTVFRGYDENGETTWYDMGSDGTSDNSKKPAWLSTRTAGVFDRVVKTGGNDWGKVSFILRLKEEK